LESGMPDVIPAHAAFQHPAAGPFACPFRQATFLSLQSAPFPSSLSTYFTNIVLKLSAFFEKPCNSDRLISGHISNFCYFSV
jgi:hypothetical protein